MPSMKSRKPDVDAGRQPDVLTHSNKPKEDRDKTGDDNKNTRDRQVKSIQGGGGGSQSGGGQKKPTNRGDI